MSRASAHQLLSYVADMLFLWRWPVPHYVQIAVGLGLALLVAALSLWIAKLTQQIRVRKRSESALLESSQRLGLALSSADMGTWRWMAATDQETRDPSFNRILGLDPVESTQALQDFIDRIHPDDRPATLAAFDRAIQHRHAFSSEFRIVRPDGTFRPLRGHGTPFYTESGVLECVTGAVTDITNEQQAQERVRLLAHALRSANDCVSVTDTAGRILFVNDAFLHTYEYEERDLIGCPFDMVRAEGSSAELPDSVFLSARPDGWRGELLTRSKSGRVFPTALSTSLVRNERGGVVAAVGVARDITEQCRVQDEWRESAERLAMLVSSLEQRLAEERQKHQTSAAGIVVGDDERERIVRALEAANGVISGPRGAAVRLGLKRTTLQGRMRRLGIIRPTSVSAPADRA